MLGGGASADGRGSVERGALDSGCCDAADGVNGTYPIQPVDDCTVVVCCGCC